MVSPNPYAPPPADASPPADDAKEQKRRRTNMINRRTVALLIESALYLVTINPILGRLLTKALPGFSATYAAAILINIPFCLTRDLLGAESPGKRLVGLSVVNARAGSPASMGARILRNATLTESVVSVVEYFVASYGNAKMQRLGDMLAGTSVIDRDPERYGRSTYNGPLVAALLGTVVAYVIWKKMTLFAAGL